MPSVRRNGHANEIAANGVTSRPTIARPGIVWNTLTVAKIGRSRCWLRNAWMPRYTPTAAAMLTETAA